MQSFLSFILTELTHTQVSDLAAELRRRIIAKLGNEVPTQLVAINIGAAFFQQADRRTDVFARADLAVESARQSDRNGLVVLAAHPEEGSSLGSHAWRMLIQTALAENRWRLLQQPVLSLTLQGKVLQAECMARLVDAQGALVPAANFMPMASRHRLMPEVDRAMVTMSLNFLSQNTQSGEIVAINLSHQSILDADFMTWFAARLDVLGSHALRLAIEVPEFAALRHTAAAMRVRDLVRAHGGKFGIDHFGLDPKAVKLLRDLIPDYVKLNGALVGELGTVASVSDLLASFVKLAHSLDVLVVAQKVERDEQVTVLMSAQVDAAQGHYFGAPQ